MLAKRASVLSAGYSSIQVDMECSCPLSCSSSRKAWQEAARYSTIERERTWASAPPAATRCPHGGWGPCWGRQRGRGHHGAKAMPRSAGESRAPEALGRGRAGRAMSCARAQGQGRWLLANCTRQHAAGSAPCSASCHQPPGGCRRNRSRHPWPQPRLQNREGASSPTTVPDRAPRCLDPQPGATRPAASQGVQAPGPPAWPGATWKASRFLRC